MKKKSEAKAQAKAERDERAALRAADRDAERAERIERSNAAREVPKKAPRRSENLDPDM